MNTRGKMGQKLEKRNEKAVNRKGRMHRVKMWKGKKR